MSDYFFQNAQIAWKGVFRNFRSNGAPIDRKYLNRQRQKIWKIQNDALKVHKKCKNFVPKKTCSDLKPLNNHFRSIGIRPIGFRSNGFRPNGFRPIGVTPNPTWFSYTWFHSLYQSQPHVLIIQFYNFLTI